MPNYAFTDQKIAERLRDMAGEVQPSEVPMQGPKMSRDIHGDAWIMKTDGSGVSARVSDVCGSGLAVPYYIADDGTLTELKANDTSITLTVWNVATGAVAANVYIQCKQVGSRLVVDWEGC